MRKRFAILSFLFIFFIGYSRAQVIDTIEVFSIKMNRSIRNIVILPAGYNQEDLKEYPVLYLLHGAQADYRTWTKVIRPVLPEDATRYNMIIVCPDGQDSWYIDSPVNPASQFETYIAKEQVRYIDTNYKVISSPYGRAIAGFSMGGFGALRLAIKYPAIYGACGSMSGAVDNRRFPKVYKLRTQLGDYLTNKKRWDEYVIVNMLDNVKPETLSIIIDCGQDDEFLKVNEELHRTMLDKDISHEYIIKPGKHNRTYWSGAIVEQLQFFSSFFTKNDKSNN